jgi:hypothetical protein
MENKRTGVVQCPKCDDRFTRENGELVLIASSTSTTSTTTSSSSNTSSTTSSTPPNNIVRPATKSASAVMVRPSVPMSNIHFYLISNVNSKGSIAFERLDDVTRLVSGVWHAIDAPSDQSRRALLCHLQRHCYRSISKASSTRIETTIKHINCCCCGANNCSICGRCCSFIRTAHSIEFK